MSSRALVAGIHSSAALEPVERWIPGIKPGKTPEVPG
jgi:hypothetical protein